MIYRIEYRQQATYDLDEIAAYLEQENPEINIEDQFMVELTATVRGIAEMPHKGSPMEFYSKRLKGLRRWPIDRFYKYLILYLVHKDVIEVVRVFHSSQNYIQILKREGF